MKRRFLSVIVVLLLLLSMTVPVLADAIMPRGSDTFAGDLYLVASNDSSSGGYPGHAFIVYKNTSYYSVQFGDKVVHPGEEVTVGTTSAEFVLYYGVWYNLEAYKYYTEGDFIANVYLHTTVTLMDIANIGNFISNWAPYYSLTQHNCVHFARGVWYVVTGVDYAYSTPADLISAMLLTAGCRPNLPIARQSSAGYYQNGVYHEVHTMLVN